MTFQDALKLLAEKRSELFKMSQGGTAGQFMICHWGKRNVAVDSLCKDDLDEIAGLIGWEYEVAHTIEDEYTRIKTGKWWAHIWKKSEEDWDDIERTVNVGADSKLEAAKAALIAIVQHEFTP